MSKWNAGYYLREGTHSIFTHGLMSFAAVCMIVACLIIMGSFSLVAVNLDYNLTRLEDENEFLAYIDESLTEEEARALQDDLERVANVSSATFIHREQAKADFIEDKDNALFQDLPDSVIRHRFSIHVTDIEDFEATVYRVENVPGIANTWAEFGVAEGFVTIRNVAAMISLALVAILAVVSLFIISNTIRLATFYRREEIAIMKMCGATNGFVRWPFVVEGAVLGLAGAGIAFLLQWGLYQLLVSGMASSGGLQLMELIEFKDMALMLLGVFCGAGFVIGVGGSVLAIRKFLNV